MQTSAYQPQVSTHSFSDGRQWLILIFLMLCRLPLTWLGHVFLSGLLALNGSANPWNESAGYARVIQVVFADTGSLLALYLILRQTGMSIKNLIQPERPDRLIAYTFVVFIVSALAFNFAPIISALIVHGSADMSLIWGNSANEVAPPAWVAWWTLLIWPVTVAIAEELIFRAYAIPALARLTKSSLLAVVISATAFGLTHITPPVDDLLTAIGRFLTLFIIGLVLGGLYLRVKNLLPLILAHWLIDFLFLALIPMLGIW
jgi:uncharacterized protein